MLLDRLSALEEPDKNLVDRTIEELSAERQADDPPAPFIGNKRAALDFCFRHHSVEKIFDDLEIFANDKDAAVSQWAAETLSTLQLRSPTSLMVALRAIRKGKKMTLLEALEMELKITTAYCVSKNGYMLVELFLKFQLHSCLLERCQP
jgi:3-hydroxyisobutyryl-CoA hydrolase